MLFNVASIRDLRVRVVSPCMISERAAGVRELHSTPGFFGRRRVILDTPVTSSWWSGHCVRSPCQPFREDVLRDLACPVGVVIERIVRTLRVMGTA